MPKGFKYLLLVFAGLLLILLCSTMQHVAPAPSGEYHYSMFLLKNYTVFTAVIFFIAGFLTGYYFRLNPWLSGFCIIFVLPFTSIYEGIVYPGSHNLIPFEFIIHFVYSLPTIIGVYLGRFLLKRITKTKAEQS
jgi:hypothetical protein